MRAISKVVAAVLLIAAAVVIATALVGLVTGFYSTLGSRPLLVIRSAKLLAWSKAGYSTLILVVANRGSAPYYGEVTVGVSGLGRAAARLSVEPGSEATLTVRLPGLCSVGSNYEVLVAYAGGVARSLATCSRGVGVEVYLYKCTCLTLVAPQPVAPAPPVPGLPAPPAPSSGGGVPPYCYPSYCPATLLDLYVALNYSSAWLLSANSTQLSPSYVSSLRVLPLTSYPQVVAQALAAWGATSAGPCEYAACSISVVEVPPYLLSSLPSLG